ncbi:MAG: alpha/beta fold hydrolase [Candidatus Aenigmatarchaeota archaeon]
MKKFIKSYGGKKICLVAEGDKTKPLVILAHGWTTSKNGKTVPQMREALKKAGFATICFDFYGHGESEGKLKDMTLSIGIRNVIDVAKFARNAGYKKICMFGSSFGGMVSLLSAPKIMPAALIVKAPPSFYIKRTLANKKGKKFREDCRKYTAYKTAGKIKCPVLIIHGTKDDVVPISQSRKLFKMLPNCKMIELKGVTHDFTDVQNVRAAKEVTGFLKGLKV